MNRQYGAISHMMTVDALIGGSFDFPAPVFQKLVEHGFISTENDTVRWNREKLELLTTDTLVDFYVSLKNTKVPNVLP